MACNPSVYGMNPLGLTEAQGRQICDMVWDELHKGDVTPDFLRSNTQIIIVALHAFMATKTNSAATCRGEFDLHMSDKLSFQDVLIFNQI